MHRHPANLVGALSAVIGAAVFVLAGCSSHESKPSSSDAQSEAPAPGATSSPSAVPPAAPLPPPEALTDVLGRLADPNVPGTGKLNLVEGATPESAATLDKFTNALRDNGYQPMTFVADNIAWSDKNPADVVASITVKTARASNGVFTFPMEFTPSAGGPGGWQLSKRTARLLLALGNSPGLSTPPAPAPAPTESPAPAPPPPPR